MHQRIAASVTDLVGNTPLVKLGRISPSGGAEVVAKLESFNPLSSVKDRIGLAMIAAAEDAGRIGPQTVLVESTSGNTGIALAFVAASKGYRLILTMPESASVERRALMKALGAELILTPAAEGMKGAIARAEQLLAELPDAIMLRQFDNPANREVHRQTTGPEIWRDCGGELAAFVAGVGTGGTITGAGEYLKERHPDLKVFAVEPADSPVLSGGEAGSHKLQGLGAGFVPTILNTAIYDEVIQVTTDEALSAARRLASEEGILCGISSGAALHAALQVAARPEFSGKRVVVILPDTGERYLSTPLFE